MSKSLYTLFFALLIFTSVIAGKSTTVHAQTAKVDAYAQTGTTLMTHEGAIKLWGLNNESINNTVFGVRAKAYIDELINNSSIECTGKARMSGGIIAYCTTANNLDIALEVIRAGLGTTNRFELRGQSNSSFLSRYSDAERMARAAGIGIWGGASQSSKEDSSSNSADLAPKDVFMIAGVFLGPIIGMLFVAAILYFGLDRMTKLQKKQIQMSQMREKELQGREKFVLAASMESEINTNRAKIDAFILIYEDMLRNLRDTSKTPKYQQSGDIIHQRPSLSRAVYDANLDRMDLVGTQIFTELSDIYAKIDPNPDYYTLEPDTPIEQVIDKVQKILTQANSLIEPMEKVNSALSMIIRERKKKVTQPTATKF
jgi:endonuclease YncB( thermonuclease family)